MWCGEGREGGLLTESPNNSCANNKYGVLDEILLCRVNVPIVVQFVVVQVYFNGFKVSETTISEYFNT